MYIYKRLLKGALIAVGAFLIGACVQQGNMRKASSGGHPVLNPSEKMQPCYECHKDVTPDIYKKWFDSRHGIGQVRCFQCHGGYDDLKVVPDVSKCSVCHTKAMEHCSTKDNSCWTCHNAHEFKASN